jgi:hypothetical protein
MRFSFRSTPAAALAAARAAPVVLLVGASPAADSLLRATILAAVAGARIESVASVTELVFRLADPGATAVVIDGAHVPDLSPTLMPLLGGMAPKLQSVLVHDAPDAGLAGARCVASAQLGAWLHQHLAGASA